MLRVSTADLKRLVDTAFLEAVRQAKMSSSNQVRSSAAVTAAAVAAGYQPLDPTLTAVAGLNASAGLIEQTGADTFTKRAMGVGAASSIPTRSDADSRYAAAAHTHAIADTTGLQAALDAKALKASTVLQPVASQTPSTNGDLVFQATSDTTLTIKFKGSDGTVRSVDLTLVP